jgi:PmbA protein
MTQTDESLNLLSDLLAAARKAGADAADALVAESLSLGVSWRMGKPEDVERSENRDLGLRVFVVQPSGQSGQACVSTSDTSTAARRDLVDRAVAMARNAPPDRFAGLADPALLATSFPDLDLADTAEPDVAALQARARIAEEAALAVAGITNTEGASASYGRSQVALATSTGFAGRYAGSRHGVSASAIAGAGTGMEQDSDFSSARHLGDLEDAARIGRSAGERAVKRLNPRKLASQAVPVLFSPRVAGSLLGHLAGAISGSAVARGTSFLKDRMGQQIFAEGVTITDDPLRRRGLRSRPFDGEGVPGQRRNLVEAGRLTTWILDSATARQLGLATTGHAARGTSSPPSPSATNLYMQAGTVSPEEMIRAIPSGFYVTDLIGFGVNGVTGDYSRGAGGFWIENGELAFPVSEMTIAGNLKDMFRNLVPASDLTFKYGTDAPTLRIDGMIVAGA